jgi:BRCT domain type II-containing protein
MWARIFIQRLVLSHGGRYSDRVNKDTTFLVIGDKPGRAKVDKADERKIPLITYESLLSQIKGKTTVSELCSKPRPDITAFSEG